MDVTTIADRVKFHDARRAFAAGAAVVVSEYGHESTLTVHKHTTTHTRETITWDELAADVRMWRNRHPNQRFYVVRAPEPQQRPAAEPRCGLCGARLELRTNVTAEQEFCGTWYDHPQRAGWLVGHTTSVLVPSDALTASLEAQKAVSA